MTIQSVLHISHLFNPRNNLVKVAQSCLTICNPVGYTVHGILQARILKWVALPFSRGYSQPRDRIQISHIASRFFTSWTTREAQEYWSGQHVLSPLDLPEPESQLGSPALQVDFLPAELSGKQVKFLVILSWVSIIILFNLLRN